MNGAILAEIAEVLGHMTEAHTVGVVARMNEAIFPNGNVG